MDERVLKRLAGLSKTDQDELAKLVKRVNEEVDSGRSSMDEARNKFYDAVDAFSNAAQVIGNAPPNQWTEEQRAAFRKKDPFVRQNELADHDRAFWDEVRKHGRDPRRIQSVCDKYRKRGLSYHTADVFAVLDREWSEQQEERYGRSG